MANLPCENGGGSLNNPSNPTVPTPGPYVAPNLCVGTWEITGIDPDLCALNEQNNQAAYVAETINISGAPLNVYKLLGVHQQGNGSILNLAQLISSTSAPPDGGTGPTPAQDYPIININVPGKAWRTFETGAAIITSGAFIGVDFGIKLLDTGYPAYQPDASAFTRVGAISITQSNVPGYYAQQVRVDIADGPVIVSTPTLDGIGNGVLVVDSEGSNISAGLLIATALSPTVFNCFVKYSNGRIVSLGNVVADVLFNSPFLNFTINTGTIPFSVGDTFIVEVDYNWKRAALFNLSQSPLAQILNLKSSFLVRAIRVTPTLFTGSENWEVSAFDVFESPPPDINNIQDLFFGENRDRDYQTAPVMLKAQFTPADSVTDLSKFGLSILDSYTFTTSFATMVKALGRPIVVGDIIEVIPEMQWDQNLKPIRKFLEVTDSGWGSAGFGPAYNPTTYRFNAQIALPSQETRDIFGTLDTQKYLVPDGVLMDGIGQQLDTTPLDVTEDIFRTASDAVPEIGSDDTVSVAGVVVRQPAPARNAKGNPAPVANPNPHQGPNLYIESALPPNGQPYNEGFTLPALADSSDGEYFRLYYPPETSIPPRLYKFSVVKNRWIYLETDRRGKYSSFKPSIRSNLESKTSQPLSKE